MNSFVGLDTTDITGGVLNAGTLLEKNNLLCFTLNAVRTFAPDALTPLFSILTVPLNFLLDALSAPLLSLQCPAFSRFKSKDAPLWITLLNKYPGAQRSKSAL